ncbi:MAG: VanZ family protein [Candidatus Brocadiae bacterium]|nr:VanZ family protein [Candidatus Brocadiia bacterium]
MTRDASDSHRAGPSRRVRLAALLCCIAAWVGAFLATHSPLPAPPPEMHVSDKTLHVVGYFTLAVVFWLTLLAYGKSGPVRTLASGIILAAYGAFDELTQPMFNRFASIEDWLADLCGIVIAVGVLQCLFRIHLAIVRRRSKN